jgi:hypothetical protein
VNVSSTLDVIEPGVLAQELESCVPGERRTFGIQLVEYRVTQLLPGFAFSGRALGAAQIRETA